jgi:outer membrane protein TolC
MKKAVVFFLHTCLAGSLFAQTLTLPTARELALERSVSVKKAKLSIKSSLLDKEVLTSDFFPALSAQGSVSASDNAISDTTASYGLSLNQKLYSGGTRITALRQNAVESLDAQEVLRSARLEVLSDADERYLGVLEKQQKKDAAEKDLEASALQLELAEVKFSSGQLDRSGLLKAQSTFASKQAAAVQARYDLAVSKRKLSSLLGISSDFEIIPFKDDDYASLIELLGGMDPVRLDALSRELLARGRSQNPGLRRKDLAVESGKLGVRTKTAAFLPTFSLSWSHAWNSSDFGSPSDSGKLTISGSIPLFPWTDRAAEVKKAQTAVQSSLYDLDDAEEQLGLSIYGTVLDLVSAIHQIESARISLSYAQEHYDGVFEKFRLSAATLSDLSDAEALLSTARSQDISSRFAFYRSWTSLIYLTGEEKESGLLELMNG